MPIKNRLLKNYKHKKKIAKRWPTNSFRLYEKDIPEFPFIIDLYDNTVVVYDLTKDFDRVDSNINKLELTKLSLIEILNIKSDQIFIKQRQKKKGTEQYNKMSKTNNIKKIKELNAIFEINLTDYLDTGLFLDHRIMRKKFFEMSSNKKILNLFSYTCSVSVMAALGGGKTYNVDLSQTYLDWGKRNFILNEIDPENHSFIRDNTVDFLKFNKEKYDLIFLDPPTFSNSKKLKEDFEVEKDQQVLIKLAMKRLDKNGILYFSTNKKSFKLLPEINLKYNISDTTKATIPFDFRDQKIHYCFEISSK